MANIKILRQRGELDLDREHAPVSPFDGEIDLVVSVLSSHVSDSRSSELRENSD